MTLFIITFGTLTSLVGIVIVFSPKLVFGLLRKNLHKPGLQLLAVVIRLILGAILIAQSGASRFPFVIEIIAWTSIVAAITLAVMGRRNFNRLMSWALSLSEPVCRAGGVFAFAFGAFLVYSFV